MTNAAKTFAVTIGIENEGMFDSEITLTSESTPAGMFDFRRVPSRRVYRKHKTHGKRGVSWFRPR